MSSVKLRTCLFLFIIKMLADTQELFNKEL